MKCEICIRQSRGFGYAIGKMPPLQFCSMRCQNISNKIQKNTATTGENMSSSLPDPSPKELIAVEFAGEQAGAYLESIGKTDLAELDGEEWKEFLLKVIGGFTESLIAQAENSFMIPFNTAPKK